MPRLRLIAGHATAVAVDGTRHGGPLADMGITVNTNVQQKYRFAVIRGGKSGATAVRGRRRGPRMRTAAEMVLDRIMHTAYVQAVTDAGHVPSEGVQKIREGEQHPWRVEARRFVEMHAQKVPHERARAIVLAKLEWLDRLYETGVETVREVVLFQPARVA